MLHCNKMYRILYKIPETYSMGNNLKENTMFSFDEQYKKVEQMAKHYQQLNDFWVQSVLSSVKEFFKVK